jgi:hypothetical protein
MFNVQIRGRREPEAEHNHVFQSEDEHLLKVLHNKINKKKEEENKFSPQ